MSKVEEAGAQGRGSGTKLTYEQEVHAVLCHAVVASEDLIRYFKAQAEQETTYYRRITLKCIENEQEFVRRIHELIPQALERRERGAAPTVEPLTEADGTKICPACRMPLIRPEAAPEPERCPTPQESSFVNWADERAAEVKGTCEYNDVHRKLPHTERSWCVNWHRGEQAEGTRAKEWNFPTLSEFASSPAPAESARELDEAKKFWDTENDADCDIGTARTMVKFRDSSLRRVSQERDAAVMVLRSQVNDETWELLDKGFQLAHQAINNREAKFERLRESVDAQRTALEQIANGWAIDALDMQGIAKDALRGQEGRG